MFNDATYNELADKIINIFKLSKRVRSELLSELSRRGLSLDEESIFALRYQSRENILSTLEKGCRYSNAQLNDIRHRLVKQDLSSLVLKFVDEFNAGKYSDADIIRLHQIIENKAPREFSVQEIKAVISDDAQKAIARESISTIDGLIKSMNIDPIDAVIQYYFGNGIPNNNIRPAMITTLKAKKELNNQKLLDILFKRLSFLNAKQLELELLEASEEERALLSKLIDATKRAITYIGPAAPKALPNPTKPHPQDTTSSAPSSTPIMNSNPKRSKGSWERFIHGEISLWKTYWFGFVGVGFSLNLLGKAIPQTEVPLILFGILVLGWQIIISVAVWRSANNYSGPSIWGVLAKLVAAISIILAIVLTSVLLLA